MATTGLTNGSRQPAARTSSEAFLGSAVLLSCTEGAGLGPAAAATAAFVLPATFTRATGLTAIAFVLTGFAITFATAGFVPATLALTETEFDCGVALAAGTAVGFTRTPTIGTPFVAGTALGPALTGFTAEACAGVVLTFEPTLTGLGAGIDDALFFPDEIVFAFAAGLPEVAAEAVFALDTAGFTETAFGVDVAGFAAGITFTETAGFTFGAVTVPLVFAPFGEGLTTGAVVVGCTLTVAGAAGFCTAVGACANAAADRSMSVPKIRII